MDDSLLVVDESVVGSALGHLTFKVPGENALIDTYVVVRNDEEVDQGSLNSTFRWSTSSSWKNNGDIYLFADLQALDLSSEGYLGASFTAANTNSALWIYLRRDIWVQVSQQPTLIRLLKITSIIKCPVVQVTKSL